MERAYRGRTGYPRKPEGGRAGAEDGAKPSATVGASVCAGTTDPTVAANSGESVRLDQRRTRRLDTEEATGEGMVQQDWVESELVRSTGDERTLRGTPTSKKDSVGKRKRKFESWKETGTGIRSQEGNCLDIVQEVREFLS